MDLACINSVSAIKSKQNLKAQMQFRDSIFNIFYNP